MILGNIEKPWLLHFFVASRPAFPTSLVFSVFGQFCVSESFEILDAKSGCVFVCCVVASLAFPASSASGTSQLINRGLSTGVGGSRSDFNNDDSNSRARRVHL